MKFHMICKFDACGAKVACLVLAIGWLSSFADDAVSWAPSSKNLIVVDFVGASDGKAPDGLVLKGDSEWGALADPAREYAGHGVRLLAGSDANRDEKREGSVTTTVKNLTPELGRWFRFRVRALAQDGFQVERDDLFLKVEFFRDGGANSLDHVRQSIYEQVERDRKSLADQGTNKNLGRATWRSFDMVFRTPFPEVDTLQLSVGFGHGQGAGANSDFLIQEWELSPISAPAEYAPPKPPALGRDKSELPKLLPLGGRWYYDPREGEQTPPAEFNYANGDRLLYLSDRLESPFADNMSAWLRKGYLDQAGQVVKQDRFVADNVVVSFTKTHLVIRSHNLPNHPTAVFPDRSRSLDGNPNYIQERLTTTRIPLEPKVNPQHVAMKNSNNNDHALPMGPIGMAVNGVVFFNPFDHLLDKDAVWRLDRCCGHPSPNSLYHYHKYPVCVKTPWSDNGAGHSPLIGFANDGFPVYGPYESSGMLAKDEPTNPLNEFNLHEDSARGPHYHVTPGKFPHIIGGFWGVAESRRGGPPGGGPPSKRPGPGRRPPPPGKRGPGE